jgi:DNA-binding NarL/FixJ family response regulator
MATLTLPRVLLADDHAGMVQALSRVLSPECDVVAVVTDGSEVAEAAAGLQPIVVVVDLNMPNVNGLDICRQIRQNTPRAHVVVVTGMTDDVIREEALAAGASAFVVKAAAAAELLDAVKRAWEKAS